MKNLYTLGVNAYRRLACWVIMCMSVLNTVAQQTPKQLSLPDVPICGGYYEYLPEGYDPAGSKTYPLLLFIHGMGEEGDGSMAQLPAVLRHGPPKLISQNTWPKTFTVNGQTFSFLVISPQFKGPAHADQLHALINYLKKTYKVDPSRVYLTGISRGGGVIWAYTSYKDEYAKNIAAIVDICGAYTPNTVLPQVLARNNLPVWGINNEGDPTVPWEWTADWVKYINAYVPTPNPKAKATIFPGGGHDSWTKVYNPSYTEDGLNIYQWMLQYQRGSTPPPPPPPPPGNKRIVVNATAPNIIYYPDAMKTLGAKPGDTLCIPAGDYQSIYFANVNGTAEKPVVITNCGGQVKLGINNPGTNVVFDMASSTFFELSGSGTPGVQYGFDINGTNTAGTRIFGMYLVNGCSDFDLHHIYFHDASTFLVAKTQQYCSNPQYWDGAYTMKNVKFHDILARNAQWEGFYIGNTKYIMNNGCGDMPSHRINGIWMYNMDIANTGSDGIQVSLADKGDNRVFNVRLDNYATEKISAHGYGILIGGGSAMRVYNNHISRGFGPGVAVFGGGLSYVYNNLITDMTYEAINIADKPLAGFDTVTAYVYNNTMDRVGLDGITSYASNTTLGHKVFNNLIICVGTPYDYPSPGLYLKGPAPMKLEASNNLHYKTAAEAGFVNAEGNDYHLVSTSKAIDAGRDMSDMQLTTDRDGAPRPVNAKFDIGAFEFKTGASNTPPTANAGQDITITLPTTSATLDGSASTDNDGSIAAYAWRKVTGPAEGATTIAATAKPAITGLVTGTYVFELTVTDDKGATAKDNITVIVKAANLPPTANAGANITIRQPATTAALDGSASKDADGSITTWAWRKVSNPAGATGDAIATPATAKTNLTGLNTVGNYVYELTVTDNNGATAVASVTVTVEAAANVPPTANAGANVNIRQPVSTASLDGTASNDPDGTITTWAWRKVSSPAGATGDAIATPAANKTDVTGLNTAGDYVFELTVTDNSGAQHSARVTVTVLAAEQNIPPVANAGANVSIQLPVSTAHLDGTASHDEDGRIVTYAWRKISNPSGATGDAIASPAADKTDITGLNTAGIYSYELTVTDDRGDQNSAVVTITVLAAHQNVPPVADAGQNISIQLPESEASLSGLGSRDEDGAIAAWAWRKVSSPAGASGDAISSPASASTDVTGLNTPGNYVYELKVTDNNGATATAQVTVTVTPRPNIPPQISIGENITITLPTSSATLDASASHDEDGTIATWAWRKLSGPNGGNIASTGASRTDVTGFTEAGTYVYELTITDNNGATATAQISVIVNPAPGPANLPPVARIDGEKIIKLPLDFVFLDSKNSTDADGQITGYQWRQLSGPSQADNSRPDKSQTRVSGLLEGEYVFELTVTDDDGATGTTTFKVTVEANDMDTDGKVTLYPVPARTFVRVMIDNPGSGSMRISIYDMNGRIKKTINETVSQVHTYQKEIELDDIMTGHYMLEVTINGNKWVKQFIKVQ